MKKLSLLTVAFSFAALMVSCGGGNEKKNYDALIANEWELVQVVNAESTADAPKGVTALFTDSTSVFGRGGCNGFFGKYETSESDKIAISTLGSTMMLCPNIEFETSYFNMLENVKTYKATADKLELFGDKKEFTLIYKVKAEEPVVEDITEEAISETGDVEAVAEELVVE